MKPVKLDKNDHSPLLTLPHLNLSRSIPVGSVVDVNGSSGQTAGHNILKMEDRLYLVLVNSATC